MATRTFLEKGQRLPSIAIEPLDGGSPMALRRPGRLATVLVTVHPGCEACRSYVDELERKQSEIEDWDGRVVATADTEALDAAGIPVPAVLIADQWGELFVIEPAGDDHTFIEPDEVVSWLRYLAIQCPECQAEAL